MMPSEKDTSHSFALQIAHKVNETSVLVSSYAAGPFWRESELYYLPDDGIRKCMHAILN